MNKLRGAIGGILAGAVIGMTSNLSLAVAAQADEPTLQTVTLDISAKGVSDALNDFAKQSGLQVVFYTEVAEGLRSPEVKGTFSSTAALELLLSATSLTYEFLNERTVAVTAPDNGQGVAARGPATNGNRENLSVSPGGQGAAAQIDASGDGQAGPAGASSKVTQNPGTSGASDENQTEGMPEVLVRGSRSLNTDIRRTESDAQPYVVFDWDEIARSQSANVDEFLKTRLPMNTISFSNNQFTGLGNRSSIDLRGLGTNQTLILVDGRRLPNVFNSGTFEQPDLNGIPLSAIERIEVLPSTASAIYGGGATGGVVNVILRRDYTGFDIKADFGDTFDGGGASRRIDLSLGISLEDDRTHILVTGSHAEADPLLVGSRDFAARGQALLFRNNPAAFTDSFSPPFGYTSNICGGTFFCDGTPLVLDDGTELNSPITFVPVGYTGAASDGGQALVANAGQYNIDAPNDGFGNRASLLNDPTVDSLSLNVRREFTPRVEAYADVSWLDNQGRAESGGILSTVSLAADAPTNPFASDILVRVPGPGLFAPARSRTETVRAGGGMIARLGHDWTASAEYNWSRVRFDDRQTQDMLRDPDADGPLISGIQAMSEGTLDVLRDVNAFPLDLESYLTPEPDVRTGPSDNVLKDATLRLSGPAFRLPGGPVMLSGLLERREEESDLTFLEFTSSGFPPFIFGIPAHSQEVNSYYLEGRAPLISASNAMRFARELELQVSARYDDYTTRAPDPAFNFLSSRDEPLPPIDYSENDVSATKLLFGLRYAPTQDLQLRGSFSGGFLPPSISQITPSIATGVQVTVIDPKRGNTFNLYDNVTVRAGGNNSLRPEDSETWSIGAVFTPRFLAGLRLSVDYTRISKSDEITFIGTQQLLDLEDTLSERITRAPLTQEEAALGYTGGVITGLDETLVNLAKTDVEAYDIQADYRVSTASHGQFRIYAVATWQPHFERQILPILPVVDSAGFIGGVLEWRGNAGLVWDKGPWTFDWNYQYYDSYLVYFAGSAQATIDAATLNQGSSSIPEQMYQDVSLAYRFGDLMADRGGALANMQLKVGIQNVFNEAPPIVATNNPSQGYSTYGDPRLRRYSVSVSTRF